MKTVSNQFLGAQARKTAFPRYRVYYKRRYWDSGSSSFLYESSWTEIQQKDVSTVLPVVHQLDSEQMNEFRVANLILSISDPTNLWKSENTSGKFGVDAGSSFGYEPYLMKFQVKAGVSNSYGVDDRTGSGAPGGNDELVSIFTGVAVDWRHEPGDGTVSVTVEGLERLMDNGDSENVSTSVSLETVATAIANQTEFKTSNNSVFKISLVRVNSTDLTEGIDYSVSNLNSFSEPAKITLSLPATAGDTVKVTYEYWKRNRKVEDLVTDLLTEAGISSYSVSAATLGSNQMNFTRNSRADYDGGTNVATDTASNPGKIKALYSDFNVYTEIDDFNSGTLAGNGWVGNGAGDKYKISSSVMETNTTADGTEISALSIRKSYTSSTYGIWQWKVKRSSTAPSDSLRVFFKADGDDVTTLNGYVITASSTGFMLRRVTAGAESTLDSHPTITITTSYQSVRVHRLIGGRFLVYVDDVLAFDVTDNTYGTSDRFVIFHPSGAAAGQQYFIDSVVFLSSSGTFDGYHQSSTFDLGANATAFGNLTVRKTQNGGTWTNETRSSSDGSSWDAWTAVSSSGAILSTFKRYLQVKISFSFDTENLYEFEISNYTVQFTTTDVYVSMANFSGETTYQSISKLAGFVDYEFGFDDDESFFFRSKTVSSTPDFTVTQADHLSELTAVWKDYDRFFSVVRAEYGTFVSESTAASSRTSPLKIKGRSVFTISDGGVLVDEDTNLADAIASSFLTRLSVLRRRVKIRTSFLPQIELSDTLSVTYKRDPWASGEQELVDFRGKVISSRHDMGQWISEFDLEEVI